MAGKFDLFGKTFDQQVDAAGDQIVHQNISPNRRISTEVVFEPLVAGVRVTARDSKHRVLWGFIGSQGMLGQTHCPVAVYEELQSLLTEELQKQDLPTIAEDGNAIENAKAALASLESTVLALKKSIEVKKVTEATVLRAKRIAQVANDANRQIALETNLGTGS
jgi:hypothetical protein